MNKPRVLFIAPLPPPVHGSAMVSQYIKDSKLVQGEFDCDFVNLSTSRRMDEIGKGGVKKLLRFIGAYFAVFFKLLCHRYDLCYLAITCHGMGFLKDAPFVLLCKLFGREVVIHQHNKGMSRCVDKQPYKWLLPLVYRNTKVILLSWYLYPDIKKVVNREQVVICPNGIPEGPLPNPLPRRGDSGIAEEDATQNISHTDCTDYTEDSGLADNVCQHELNTITQKRSSLAEGKIKTRCCACVGHPDGVPAMSVAPSLRGRAGGEAPHLLFLSNLIPSKGVYVLLDACRLLSERGVAFACDFVGGETKEIDRATFEEAVRERGLEGMVCYQGPKYGEEKERYFAHADIFVFPTFYFNECFPLVLLEAMQWRLPLVSSDEGGIPDLVKDGVNGFVCPREDAHALADALGRLITDPALREQMGERGHQRYREEYTLKAFEQKFVSEMYKCLRDVGCRV